MSSIVKLSRRRVLGGLGTAVAAARFAPVMGCTGGGGSPGGAGATGAAGAAGSSEAWATGGTAVMTGDYADPFASGAPASCTLTCSATRGPCHAQSLERKDISEGHDGLPLRLAFLIVDESCQPIAGATLDLWHTAPEGMYSGADSVPMCTLDDEAALAGRWFRGMQTTAENGRVDFDTCFPGWYRGRTIHIHFSVRIGETEYVTSQLYFDDTLSDEIVANQLLYSERGPRDTNNATDALISADDADEYVFQTARMADGAMLAWKKLVVRSSTANALCSVGGGTEVSPGGPPR